MFEYTTKSGRLTVYEAFNGYYVTCNDPNVREKTRGIGDGTIWVSGDDDQLSTEEAERLKHDRLTDDVEHAEAEWLEAYFGRR